MNMKDFMKDYVPFKPSKEPIYQNRDGDMLYLFNGDKLMVREAETGYEIPKRDEIKKLGLEIHYDQCLGAFGEVDCFGGIIEDEPLGYSFVDLRTYSFGASYDEFLISSKAFLLSEFVRTNQRCGICGFPMTMKEEDNDRAMICTNCGHMVWPKTSPAIIVAVTKKDKLLLAHNKMFANGMYSVVAGFVEMGETLEDCIRREVLEETGIKVHNIKYFGSQPWAFPNSYMMGFTAEYLEGEIKVDNEEIVDANWYSKDEIPGLYRESVSISTRLIEWFLEA